MMRGVVRISVITGSTAVLTSGTEQRRTDLRRADMEVEEAEEMVWVPLLISRYRINSRAH